MSEHERHMLAQLLRLSIEQGWRQTASDLRHMLYQSQRPQPHLLDLYLEHTVETGQ